MSLKAVVDGPDPVGSIGQSRCSGPAWWRRQTQRPPMIIGGAPAKKSGWGILRCFPSVTAPQSNRNSSLLWPVYEASKTAEYRELRVPYLGLNYGGTND